MSSHVLAIDQGTSSSRALVYDSNLNEVARAQQEFPQHYPKPGWVEHDALEIWHSVTGVLSDALAAASLTAADIAAIGITNQRETTVIWDRQSGEPIAKAIVWQDRRTADACEQLRSRGVEPEVSSRTGLRLDPYFSATKIAWLLDNVDGARTRAERGELCFGTIDSFLIWRLTGGKLHATDATNASRTLLFNIREQAWDPYLAELFGVPASMLPEVRDCVADYGVVADGLPLAGVQIGGVAGDQHAALAGQAGFERGMMKSTFGTGCFVVANTGDEIIESQNNLLATTANRIGGKVTYALEGSVFVAGSAIQWLRDSLKIVDSSPDTEAIAEKTGVVEDIVVVPAFTGLGAPYWDPHARGAILGLTRGTGRDEIITATLQAIACQTADLITAMTDDGIAPAVIRVDGGMAANNWFLEFLANLLDVAVERPKNVESTVLGAACFAAIYAGILASTDEISGKWQLDRRFEPSMNDAQRARLLSAWSDAVARVRGAR